VGFMEFYDERWAEPLGMRSVTMRAALDILDKNPDPVVIVETGCMRVAPNVEQARGDGSSTLLWDEFVNHHGGEVYSCEINRAHCDLAADFVSEKTSFVVGNAVRTLMGIPKPADLIYLDSFDLDWDNPHPSALHHLMEMASAARLVKAGTLILIDDCGANGGKGMYVLQWLTQIGAEFVARDYQTLWRVT
jgi:hypothetical protein